MKAAEVNIVKFLKQTDTQFVIPVYQRVYQWTLKQCEQLLKDIIEVGNRETEGASHFIGSIVYMHDGVYSSGANYLTVIDGQQRLTTLYLILLVLHHKAAQMGKEMLARQILDAFLINPYFQSEKSEIKLKLRPVKKDDAAVRHLLNGQDPTTFADPASRVIQNYQFVYSRINEQNFEAVRKGIDRLLFVEISLESGKDDPQRIFQSLNSTGLDLSQGDLIRNYLLLDLKPEQQDRIYEQYWTDIENFTSVKPENQNKLSDFIRHYLTLKNHEIPTRTDVFDAFQTLFPNKDLNQRESLINDLKKYASLYARIINPSLEPDLALRKQISSLNCLEYTSAYPFVLALLNDYEQKKLDRESLLAILDFVQSYLWRRFICGLPSNVLTRVFLHLREMIENATGNYLKIIQTSLRRLKGQYRFPTDPEFLQELKVKDVYNIPSKKRVYLLERLENYQNNEPVQIEGNKEITIEHILPRSYNARWKAEIGESYEILLEERVHTLANLTLSGNNGALGSRTFKEKRDIPEKGYRASRLYLNKFLAKQNTWTEAELDARFQHLSTRILEIWRFPATIAKQGELINIFDVRNIQGKFIHQATLFGKKVDVYSFRALLEKVANAVYEKNPRQFVSLKRSITIANKPEGLKMPIPIADKYFIDGKGNTELQLRKIKHLLNRYPNELYVLLKEQPFKEQAPQNNVATNLNQLPLPPAKPVQRFIKPRRNMDKGKNPPTVS